MRVHDESDGLAADSSFGAAPLVRAPVPRRILAAPRVQGRTARLPARHPRPARAGPLLASTAGRPACPLGTLTRPPASLCSPLLPHSTSCMCHASRY
ncbi:hypothetical protein GCM10027258_80860 [Amycolatopsis stemonae]